MYGAVLFHSPESLSSILPSRNEANSEELVTKSHEAKQSGPKSGRMLCQGVDGFYTPYTLGIERTLSSISQWIDQSSADVMLLAQVLLLSSPGDLEQGH